MPTSGNFFIKIFSAASLFTGAAHLAGKAIEYIICKTFCKNIFCEKKYPEMREMLMHARKNVRGKSIQSRSDGVLVLVQKFAHLLFDVFKTNIWRSSKYEHSKYKWSYWTFTKSETNVFGFFSSKQNFSRGHLCQMSLVLWDWKKFLLYSDNTCDNWLIKSLKINFMCKHFVACVFLETRGDNLSRICQKIVFSGTFRRYIFCGKFHRWLL